MKWVVTDTKYLTKPSKDWQPHIPTANTDTAYIEVTTKLFGDIKNKYGYIAITSQMQIKYYLPILRVFQT